MTVSSEPPATVVAGGLVYLDGDPVAQQRDLRLAGGVVAEVGEPGVRLAADGAALLDAGGKLVVPGLVDTHLHLWQTPLRGMTADLWAREYFHTVHPMSQYYTPEDMYWATYAGGLELLAHGVTQVFDYCHSVNSPEHADASLRGLRDAGIRATYGFGLFERESATYADRAHRLDDLARVTEAVAGEPLVDIALALDHAYDDQAVGLARELGLGISVHGNPVGLADQFAAAGALAPDVLWVHGNYASERELDALAASGASLSLTPDIEMGMGKPTAIFDRAVRRGIPIALGVDVVSYACADLLTQMRLAYALHRVIDGEKERARGHVPPHRDTDVPLVSTRDVVRWATTNGRRALGDRDHQGIRAGAPADLLLVETEPWGLSLGDPAGHLVLQTTSRDVDTVLVAGEVRVRGGRLVGIDGPEISARLAESRDRLLATRDLALSTH
ncbi:amidohydrolase family protein [Nocardioides sp. L-11A]|uniref:amidohydrolase family protein n=1 Tax=Nocardioides sp. L-11A TaxID=3043848 RepID=UPI00249A99F6|nr:amidohydrolase family protein [Nocardioides sp. L-11A]